MPSCKFKSNINLNKELISITYKTIKYKTDQQDIEKELDKIIYHNLLSTTDNPKS